MITIKMIDENNAELTIPKQTPHVAMLLGTEMLMEAILKEIPSLTIDDALRDIKRIYERDNNDRRTDS